MITVIKMCFEDKWAAMTLIASWLPRKIIYGCLLWTCAKYCAKHKLTVKQFNESKITAAQVAESYFNENGW